jgi:hypothetical protein
VVLTMKVATRALLAAVAAAALAGCSTAESGQPAPAPEPPPPAQRLVVEASVGRYLDAIAELPSPSCCLAPGYVMSAEDLAKQRQDQEGYGRQYCAAIIRGVPVEGVVMEVFGAGSARSQFAHDSARLAGEILCPAVPQ